MVQDLQETDRFDIFLLSIFSIYRSVQWSYMSSCMQDKALVPRSSSPVTVYVELPCIIEQGMHLLFGHLCSANMRVKHAQPREEVMLQS